MNTVRFFTTALVGIVTTCVLSAGAASAQPVPYVPKVAAASSPSLIAAQHAAVASSKAQLLRQKARIAHMQRELTEQALVEKGSGVANPGQASQRRTGTSARVTPTIPSPQSGDGTEVAVLAVTALVGLALGAAGSSASRRLRHRSGLPA
jgi:hypothetical protein